MKSKTNEYIPVSTSKTIYYEPQTQQEMTEMVKRMNLGDMILRTENNLWYTMGLIDRIDPESLCLFPNITMDEVLEPLSHWGMERKSYLQKHKQFLVAQMGMIGLHKHCLVIEAQALMQYSTMMAALRKDAANKVTEKDKCEDPIAWIARMNNYKHRIHEVIYNDLIYS